MESVDGNGCGGGNMQLVSELGRVLELVRQLELHLHAPCSSSVELCRSLAAQIVALTDRSIAIVVSSSSPRLPEYTPAPGQLSGTPSPLSGVSDHQQPFGRGGKKRKTSTAMWRSQVRAGGGEGPGDDGHSWRKYGQKDILGAKHPRAYYRCTHRNSQGCAATKQVQRADHDPALFDVVYHGDHTCTRGTGAGAGAKRPHAQTLLQSLGAGLTVDTDVGNAAATPLTPENYLPAAARGVSPSPAGSEYSAGGVAASPYPGTGYGEWPCDGDLQEIVSAFTAAPQPASDPEFLPYFFEFDPNMASLFP